MSPLRRFDAHLVGTLPQEDSPYNVVFWREDEDARVVYCFSIEDSIAVHPADAAWECKDLEYAYPPVSTAALRYPKMGPVGAKIPFVWQITGKYCVNEVLLSRKGEETVATYYWCVDGHH